MFKVRGGPNTNEAKIVEENNDLSAVEKKLDGDVSGKESTSVI